MNLTPEIIEAIFTGLILGMGMVVYRVYQYQVKDQDNDTYDRQDSVSSNGFRLAMETVKEAHTVSVELLHEQIDIMEVHVEMLETQNANRNAVIERLQKRLRTQGIMTDDEGYVINSQYDVQE